MHRNFWAIASMIVSTSVAHAAPSPEWLRENADVYRAEQFQGTFVQPAADTPGADEDLNDPALTKVTRDFGPSVIDTSQLPIRMPRANADKQVWASYWYPRSDRILFDANNGFENSTLDSYDLFRREVFRTASNAANVERSAYTTSVAPWEGLCDAWSIAAVSLPEPTVPVYFRQSNNRLITFSVSDQKALLLKAIEGMPGSSFQVYGQRFDGQPNHVVDGQSAGWIQPDLYPDQFHRFLEVMVLDKKLPFVMDHDPSEAVWSEPVDGAKFEIYPVRGRRDQVFVRTFLFPAKQLNRETRDQVGKNEHIREYNYILGGNVDWNGKLHVGYGIWLSKAYVASSQSYRNDTELKAMVNVDSRRSHPDFVYTVPSLDFASLKPVNAEIDPAVVTRILSLPTTPPPAVAPAVPPRPTPAPQPPRHIDPPRLAPPAASPPASGPANRTGGSTPKPVKPAPPKPSPAPPAPHKPTPVKPAPVKPAAPTPPAHQGGHTPPTPAKPSPTKPNTPAKPGPARPAPTPPRPTPPPPPRRPPPPPRPRPHGPEPVPPPYANPR